MCEVCRTNPCDPRCPNSPDPPVFAECENCGKEIYDGDDYWEIDDKKYCEKCIDKFHKFAEVEEYVMPHM